MRFLSQFKNENFSGRTCLLRVDFNVDPVRDREGPQRASVSNGVEDDKNSLRLEAPLPTIEFLLRRGARVVILSHRGRPTTRRIEDGGWRMEGQGERMEDGGERMEETEEKGRFSLKPFVPFLEKKLKRKVVFLPDIPRKSLPAGRQARSSQRSSAKVFLLENLRFWPGEEKNDLNFAKKLAQLAKDAFYVNDAFGVCHRKNASVTQLPKLLPSYAGLLLEKEIKTLSKIMKFPKKPLILIFGGAKLKDKIQAIKNLLPKADKLLLGSSALQKVNIQHFTLLKRNKKLVKPIDWVTQNKLPLDIGPLTIQDYKKIVKRAKTIIWNGPLGKFEDRRFAQGSIAIAKAVAQSKAFAIIGGGETTTLFMGAIPNYQLLISKGKIFLSTGGGAMLEFLSGGKLPGIEALDYYH